LNPNSWWNVVTATTAVPTTTDAKWYGDHEKDEGNSSTRPTTGDVSYSVRRIHCADTLILRKGTAKSI
jgi:hypothetical protein